MNILTWESLEFWFNKNNLISPNIIMNPLNKKWNKIKKRKSQQQQQKFREILRAQQNFTTLLFFIVVGSSLLFNFEL